MGWLFKSIEKILSNRKEDLRSKKAGSLSMSAEPRIIWCTALRRPHNLNESVVPTFKLIRKFNDVLKDEVRRNDKYNHIMYLESLDEYGHFDNLGKLSSSGKSKF